MPSGTRTEGVAAVCGYPIEIARLTGRNGSRRGRPWRHFCTLSVSNRLHKTYNPVDVAAVRVGDAAREVGRGRIKQERKP
jgi:hypothetical protein